MVYLKWLNGGTGIRKRLKSVQIEGSNPSSATKIIYCLLKIPTMKKLILLFLFGLISGFSFNVSAGNKCEISIERDTITCTDGEDVWTCRPAGRNEYFCEGKLTSWTTDCPYCGKPRK